jgi:hypothetical protein
LTDHHAVPLLHGDLHEGPALQAAVEGRVVDEHVDAAEPRERLGGQALRVGLARHVALDPEGLRPARLDLLHGRLRVGQVRHDDACALRGRPQAVRAADALGASGDDDDLLLESHGSLLAALVAPRPYNKNLIGSWLRTR